MLASRITWLSAWLAIAFGCAWQVPRKMGAVVHANLWLAALAVCIGLLGFFLLRWRLVAYTDDPNEIRGGITRRGGLPVSRQWFVLRYTPGGATGPLRLKLWHPRDAQVFALMVKTGPGRGTIAASWEANEERSPLRTNRRGADVRIYDREFADEDRLLFFVEANEGLRPRLWLFRAGGAKKE